MSHLWNALQYVSILITYLQLIKVWVSHAFIPSTPVFLKTSLKVKLVNLKWKKSIRQKQKEKRAINEWESPTHFWKIECSWESVERKSKVEETAVPNILLRISEEVGEALFIHSTGMTEDANRQGFNTSLKVIKCSYY